MQELQSLMESIRPVDQHAYEACIANFNRIAKPLGSLGKLETLLARIASVVGDPFVRVKHKCVLVFCADNGECFAELACGHCDRTWFRFGR